MELEEIYLLITRYLARQTSSDENTQLATWVAQSPENERTFEQLKAVWQRSQTPTATPETAVALRSVKARLAQSAPQPVAPARRWRMARRHQFVAMLLLVGLVGGGYAYLKPSPAVAYQTCRTMAGQKQQVRLPDGSLVTLAPQSQLRYPAKFSDTNREVYLEGEAFFEVSKNPHRPFRVHSGTWVTQVLGTKFNVSAVHGAGQTAVSLVEGKVEVFDRQEHYLLAPGQQLRAEHATGHIYRQSFDAAKVTGWRTNKLVFRNEKLGDVAGQIERLYGVKLVFADAATAEVRLWATFENEPLPAVLAALQLAGPLSYRREGQVIYLQQPTSGNAAE
ncbi:FecR family protein [Hymenobacter negativus]|uniref:FecR domain-containing protein n=1 Tax=Hymenobacter negativus TaxID=2795026 RepID=A0ABS3QG40_9BACT|nr:FecR domain-containing protein [Hymenobacter negativus]MBO2010071.1 FecR domain-containing protein [Hymenobacter negativus]